MTDFQQKATTSFQTGDRPQNDTFNSNSTCNGRYQYSRKNQPCPICGRTKDEDCRWNAEVVLCHTHVDHDACIPNYVYRGSKEIWGQYFPKVDYLRKPIRSKAEKEFLYSDLEDRPLVKVTRIDDGAGKKKIFQSHWNGQVWVKGLTPQIKQRIRLYRIDEPLNRAAIAQGKPLLIVEGEGKVDLLINLGVAATCAIGGAGKWKAYGYPNYLKDLAEANIILCPDQDRPGLNHCLEIEQDFPTAQWLYAFPQSPQWQNLPKKGGLDIADWVNENELMAEQILSAIETKRSLKPAQHSNDTRRKPTNRNVTQLLLDISEEASFFHTPDRKVYADVLMSGVRKVYPIKHEAFKQWFRHELFKRHEKTAGLETLNQVLGVLEARATFEGIQREVYLRLAEYEGKVYLDLGTEDWQAVEIDPTGWRIVSDYPVRFRRPKALRPLPEPERGGSLIELRQLLNLDDEAWILLASWLLFCLQPKCPHPILILYGEQGSGKSYAAGVLKSLIDPGGAPLVPHIADLRNLAIAAENRWILAYDNLSGLSVDQSDALCRISTGGGFSTRTLYENDEETVFEFMRPQILTGIDPLATRGDLLDRALLVKLSSISEVQRMTEAQLNDQLKQLTPRILGALLTALSQTLKELPTTKSDWLPRMADFAQFAIAAESALDLPVGSFLHAYRGNQQEARETALDASPLAIAIQRLMTCRENWHGTATELLAELERLMEEKVVKSKQWTGNVRALGKALPRLAPNLRAVGIEVQMSRTSQHRIVQIDRTVSQTSQTSQTSYPQPEQKLSHDVSSHLNLAEQPENVMNDKSPASQRQTSSHSSQDVMVETVTQLDLSMSDDNSDMSDNKNTPDAWSNPLQIGDRVNTLNGEGRICEINRQDDFYRVEGSAFISWFSGAQLNAHRSG